MKSWGMYGTSRLDGVRKREKDRLGGAMLAFPSPSTNGISRRTPVWTLSSLLSPSCRLEKMWSTLHGRLTQLLKI